MSRPPLSADDRAQAIGMLLGVPPEQARIELATREARQKVHREAFHKLDATTAAPLIACLRAAAEGYPEIGAEMFMLLAWICWRWERDGKIPTGEPQPIIVMPPEGT